MASTPPARGAVPLLYGSPAMHREAERPWSVAQAARTIFNTARPTERQLGQVRQMILRGVLRGSRKGHWSTTSEAVAEYLAARSEHGTRRHRERGGAATSELHRQEVLPLYREWLKDYFLAVIRRKGVAQASERFRRAVLAGQVVGVALILLLFWAVYRSTVSPGATPEQQVAEAWIERNTDEYRILRWFAPAPGEAGAVNVRVRYQYRSQGSRRPITTDRVFVVRDGRVASVSNADF